MKDSVNRRKFLGGTAAAVTGTAAMTGEAAAHKVGAGCFATDNVNIRDAPGLHGNVIATAGADTGMYVEGGPWSSDGYRWWQVRVNGDGNNGRIGTGYVVEAYTRTADFGLPSSGRISSSYYSSRPYGYHSALDIANGKYTNVHAGRGGYHTHHYASGCGNYSVIDHGGGYETLYCHLNSWVAGHGVNVGYKQHIAEMGNTGNSSGDHVHYEVNYNGDEAYIPGNVNEYVYGWAGVGKNYSGISVL